MTLVSEARTQRSELEAAVRLGAARDRPVAIGFEEVHERFIMSCAEGIALNKQGRSYKRKAVVNLDSSLKRLPPALRSQQLNEITRGDFQLAVDELRRAGLSSSRVRSIINAARSLYRWAQDRELAIDNPPAPVRLPASDSIERNRVATPREFTRLLVSLEPPDAMPFALAAYGSARAQEIRALGWAEVDIGYRTMLLADDERSRKSPAAWRTVPLVWPLFARLRVEWIANGCPHEGRVCPPRRKARSGMISLDQLQKRVRKVWQELDLEPISLLDARHTFATWLDHAGVTPKVASALMGHKAPRRQFDIAPITLRTYTHVLPGEMDRARDQLDAFLASRENEEGGGAPSARMSLGVRSTRPEPSTSDR